MEGMCGVYVVGGKLVRSGEMRDNDKAKQGWTFSGGWCWKLKDYIDRCAFPLLSCSITCIFLSLTLFSLCL